MRIVSACLAVILCFAAPAHAQQRARPVTFTILHFNDVYEITPVEGGRAGGLARVAPLPR